MNVFAKTVTIEEFSFYLSSSDQDKSLSTVFIGKESTINGFEGSNVEVTLSQNIDANDLGIYTVAVRNLTGTDLQNVKAFGFVDLSIDETTNSFFNEHGQYISIDGNGNTDLNPDFWQIDEPDYLSGKIIENLQNGLLDQTNHIPENKKDDTSLAIGFNIGDIPANGTLSLHYTLSSTNIGGLAQVDPDSNQTYYLNAMADEIVVEVFHEPVTADDYVTAQSRQSVTINVLGNDSDEDNDLNPLSVNIIHAAAQDTDADGDKDRLVVAGEGNWSVSNATGSITFTPELNFTGDPTPISYVVSDRTALVSNTASITVNYPQSAPVTTADTASAATSQSVTIDLLANDTDAENDINPSSVSITAALAVDTDADGDKDRLIVAGEGNWSVNNVAGNITFTPEFLFTGDPAPISYVVSDHTGLTSNATTVTIDYLQIAPVTADDLITVQTRHSVMINVLSNDSDADNDLLVSSVNITTPLAVDTDADGDNDRLVVPGEGNWSVINITGDVIFSPASNFTADPTPISYNVLDRTGLQSNTATVTVDYLQIVPVTVDDMVTAQTRQIVTVNALGNDSDADQDINPNSVNIIHASSQDSDADGDKDSLIVAGEGNWSVNNATGSITFSPETDFTADPTPISYNVADKTGLTSNAATVTVDYLQIAPIAVDDLVTAQTGLSAMIHLLNNDSDADNDLLVSSVSITEAVAVDTDTDGDKDSLTVAGEGNWSVSNATGSITFTPELNFTGDPTPISYVVSDRTALVSNTASITVDYPQTAPVTTADTASSATSQSVTIDILANDTDAENDINPGSVNIIAALAVDTDADGDKDSLIVAGEGNWSVNAAGSITFSPAPNFTVDPMPISYVVSDRTGLISNASTITVDYPQTAPVTTADTSSSATSQSVIMDILANDTDAENDINPSSVNITASTAVDTDADGDKDSLIVAGEGNWSVSNATGSMTFSPEPNFTADPTPISYVVSDRTGLVSNAATITIDYLQIAPVTVDDSLIAQTRQIAIVNVLNNDSDANSDILPSSVNILHASAQDSDGDGDKDTLIVTGEGNWSVEDLNGMVSFTPEADFTADPTPISYNVTDKTSLVSNASIITVDYPQTAPVATSDTVSSAASQSVTITILANDSDAQNDINPTSVDITASSAIDTDADGDKDSLIVAGEGNWSVNAAGRITFSPEPYFTADPTPISYVVSDRTGLTSNAATITIDYLQSAPITVDDSITAQSRQSIQINVLNNDSDADNDLNPFSVNIIHAAAQDSDGDGDNDQLSVAGEGNWSVDNATGVITFTPATDFTADPTPISYTIADRTGLISNASTITVDYPQTAPVTTADAVSSATSLSVTISILANDTDAENDINPLSVSITHAAAQDTDADGDKDTLIVIGEGNWTVNNVTGSMTFNPVSDFTADPTPVSYVVSDGTGLVSNASTVTIDYLQIAPVTADDSAEAESGKEAIIYILDNDSDANNDIALNSVHIADSSAIDRDSDGDHDFLVVEGEGNWSANNETGEMTFTAVDTIDADPTPISYTIKDRTGLVSNSSQINITYIPDDPGNGGGSGECQNLIINGSFEEHRKFNHHKWGMHSKTAGWLMHPAAKISDGDAADGSVKIELDAHTNGNILQSVDTDKNTVYDLIFSYIPRTDQRPFSDREKKNEVPSERAVEVYWDDQKVITVQGGEQVWQTFTIRVSADSKSSNLMFQSVGSGENYSGYIDNVKLCGE